MLTGTPFWRHIAEVQDLLVGNVGEVLRSIAFIAVAPIDEFDRVHEDAVKTTRLAEPAPSEF